MQECVPTQNLASIQVSRVHIDSSHLHFIPPIQYISKTYSPKLDMKSTYNSSLLYKMMDITIKSDKQKNWDQKFQKNNSTAKRKFQK